MDKEFDLYLFYLRKSNNYFLAKTGRVYIMPFAFVGLSLAGSPQLLNKCA